MKKMMFKVQLLPLFLTFVTLPIALASQGYEENSYEQPPSKMKFNIGFNLPSMSISLPKLELPQISIKASVKNKKPFTLKLPVIKFNGYANSEEDNSYGGGDSYGANNAGGGGGGQSYSSGPTAYASGSGASGYVNAQPENVYGGQGGGYEPRPAVPTYGAASEGPQYGPSEPAYASSGYSTATQQAPSSAYQTKPQYNQVPNQPQQQQHQQPQPQQPAYQIQNSYQPVANVYHAPTRNTQVVNPSPYTGTLPTTAANGYYVPRPVNNHHQPQQQVPSYREEPKSGPVQLYQAGSGIYQGSNPYDTSPEQGSVAAAYSTPNGQIGYSSFNRRSNRLSNTHFPSYRSLEAAATLPEGRYVLAPIGDETYKWQPILLRV